MKRTSEVHVEYFSVTTNKKQQEASRIAADMRFSFTLEPNKNLPLLKAYKMLILTSNNRMLRHYYFHYFKEFDELVDVVERYGPVDPYEQVLVQEFENRIDDFLQPAKVKERNLGIPENKTSSIINEIDMSRFYSELQ